MTDFLHYALVLCEQGERERIREVGMQEMRCSGKLPKRYRRSFPKGIRRGSCFKDFYIHVPKKLQKLREVYLNIWRVVR